MYPDIEYIEVFLVNSMLGPPIPNVQSVLAHLSQLHFSGGSTQYTGSELDDFVAEMEAKVRSLSS